MYRDHAGTWGFRAYDLGFLGRRYWERVEQMVEHETGLTIVAYPLYPGKAHMTRR